MLTDERDKARIAFYKSADRGEPMHWRDMGPDEVWNASWEAGAAVEREACARILDDEECESCFCGGSHNVSKQLASQIRARNK